MGFRAAALAGIVRGRIGPGPVRPADLPPGAARDIDDPKPVYKYELKPEHGEFLVFVKSFPGEAAGGAPRARQLAEGLAEYIRSECRLYAYVHETRLAQRQERNEEKEASSRPPKALRSAGRYR